VLSTIARTGTSILTTKLAAEDILGIVPRGTHDWNKYIDAKELREFLKGRRGGVMFLLRVVFMRPGPGGGR